jgi:hypothetical protein
MYKQPKGLNRLKLKIQALLVNFLSSKKSNSILAYVTAIRSISAGVLFFVEINLCLQCVFSLNSQHLVSAILYFLSSIVIFLLFLPFVSLPVIYDKEGVQAFLIRSHTLLRSSPIHPIYSWESVRAPELSSLGSMPVIGYRLWDIKSDNLVSPYRGDLWNKNGYFEANCTYRDIELRFSTFQTHSSKTPEDYLSDLGISTKATTSASHLLSCGCGFYAFYSLGRLLEEMPLGKEPQALGVIAGYGSVAFHQSGFRVEKGKIVALVDPFELAAVLACIKPSHLDEYLPDKIYLNRTSICTLMNNLDYVNRVGQKYNLPVLSPYRLGEFVKEFGEVIQPSETSIEPKEWISRIKV